MTEQAEGKAKDFLARWSQRKQNAAVSDNASDTEPHSAAQSAAQEGLSANSDDAAPYPDDIAVETAQNPVEPPSTVAHSAADEDMPPLESLTANSDISDFFKPGVSSALRKAALRHVFQQPEYNIRDGLNDYDGDYTVFEPLGDTITADMKFHAARKERERLEALAGNEQAGEPGDEQAVGQPEAGELSEAHAEKQSGEVQVALQDGEDHTGQSLSAPEDGQATEPDPSVADANGTNTEPQPSALTHQTSDTDHLS